MTKINYPIGDFLVRIKNAVLARNREVVVEKTKLIVAVAKVLKKSGYLSDFQERKGEVIVRLAYRKKEPVILDMKLVSKPGLRVYKNVDELEKKRGPSTYIISTSKGILTSNEAIKKRVGGEVIVEII